MPVDKSQSVAFANVAASQTDSVLVAAVPGRKIRVLSVVANAGDTTPSSVTFNSKGAGAGTAVSALLKSAANGLVVLPDGGGWFQTNPGEALTVTTSAGSTTGIQVAYAVVS